MEPPLNSGGIDVGLVPQRILDLASMEPPLNSGGIRSAFNLDVIAAAASMEPPLNSGGIICESCSLRASCTLQWSRR